MNIQRKKLIDLSRANLIPERLRAYVTEIYDEIVRFPKADSDLQRCYLGMCIAENWLETQNLSAPCWRATVRQTNAEAGLIALKNKDPNWRQKRNPNPYHSSLDDKIHRIDENFPFFQTYAYDNRLSFEDALRCLLLCCEQNLLAKKIVFPDSAKEFFRKMPLGHTKQSRSTPAWLLYSIDYNVSYEWTDDRANDGIPLFNHELMLKDDTAHLRPIFLTESFLAAESLEQAIWNNQIHVDLRQLVDDLRIDFCEDIFGEQISYMDADGSWRKKFGNIQNPQNIKDLLQNLILHLRYYKSDIHYPLGDAIWSAPFGGFSIPEYTDWMSASRRNIYVFKFGEQNEKKAREELLNLYATIPYEEERKVSFVIFPKRTSPNSRENDIRILSSGEMLESSLNMELEIPEPCLRELDIYLREHGKKRSTTPYIIEPFLRKNSWALLSGEAGVGKSFLAMGIGMAIASHGKLFGNWRVHGKCLKVLYVTDDEMTHQILEERRETFKRMYRESSDFIIQSVRELNLLDNGMSKIEKFIEQAVTQGETTNPVGVLILDHLLKLSGTVGAQREYWPKIRRWIEDLNRQGIAVLLLHHEYGGTRMQGTALISNDAPARISMERPNSPDPDENHLAFQISIPKNRGGKDQRTSMAVTLVLGRHPHWTIGDHAGNMRSWKKLSDMEQKKTLEEMRGRLTIREIAEHLDVSKSTIEKALQRFNLTKPSGSSANSI